MRFGRADHTKGLGLALVSATKRIDCSLKFRNGSEHAALEAAVGELGEETFDGIEPGRRGWREVEGPAGMLREPFAHLRVPVSGIVVDDRMDRLSPRNLGVDVIEEADELLMPVALHVATDDGAVENVEGGEQGGCAVAFVVVGHRPGAPRLHRQSRLGAVEGLDRECVAPTAS